MGVIIQTEIPEQLAQQAYQLIEQGWAIDMQALITESISRYVQSHQSALNEQFILEDVEWGLHGQQ